MRRAVPALLASLSLAATALVATGAAGPASGAAPTAGLASAARAAAGADQPTRVVIILVDALSRQFVRRYDMDHVQALMRQGTDFPHSILGHMGAETVVSHNVLTSGQLPKHMGWTDEYMRDVDGVLTDDSPEPENPYWLTGSLTSDQMFALQEHEGYPKLADYLHEAQPGSTVATVSPKAYAAWGMGGAGSDSIVTFSSRNFDCDGDTVADNTWRGPDGVDVPAYLSARSAAATTSSRLRPSRTTPTCRRPGCTRWTATATPSAATPRTKAATCGQPTQRCRSCGTSTTGAACSCRCRASTSRCTCGAASTTRAARHR